jgi:hypothetical protein
VRTKAKKIKPSKKRPSEKLVAALADIVDLLSQAYDELKAISDASRNQRLPSSRRRAKLLKRIDKAFGLPGYNSEIL